MPVSSVSVPYRGLIFLNLAQSPFSFRMCGEKFPSPTGDLYFSILMRKSAKMRLKNLSFRPLPGTYISQFYEGYGWDIECNCFRPLPGTYISQSKMPVSSSADDLFPSPTGDLYFSIPSPQFLVNTDCITQFAWEMIFQKYKFIFHYKKLSKCLFYAVRGKTNIF